VSTGFAHIKDEKYHVQSVAGN